MTPADLAALERLLAEATPGTWVANSTDDDARLIVAMHSALPELIAAARERERLWYRAHNMEEMARKFAGKAKALRAEVERLRAVVEAAREFKLVCEDWVQCDGWDSYGALSRALAALQIEAVVLPPVEE